MKRSALLKSCLSDVNTYVELDIFETNKNQNKYAEFLEKLSTRFDCGILLVEIVICGSSMQ